MGQQIFLKKRAVNKRVGDIITYDFYPTEQKLVLYNCGWKCFECNAKAGQSFFIHTNPPKAVKVLAPEKKKDIIKYLLGIKRCDIINSQEEIENIYRKHPFSAELLVAKDKHYELIMGGAWYKIWINDLITKKEIIDLMQAYIRNYGISEFPKHYVKAVLKAKMRIKGKDVDNMYGIINL